MMTSFQQAAIVRALSPVRMGTYVNAQGFSSAATALDIYVWNALVSGAFFSSLHICEVVIRNAVSEAIEKKFGAQWPWCPGFERTLINKWKWELARARQRMPLGSTGKVIAELKFAFWCNMLTASHDQHLWNASLHAVFPNLPLVLSIQGGRKVLYDELDALRHFRNRIAHHEPVFAHKLAKQQARIARLINFRDKEAHQWLLSWEKVSAVLSSRP